MVFAISTRVAAISSTVRTVKSSSSGPVVRWRWRSRRVISTAVGSTSSALRAETVIWFRWVMPSSFFCRVV